MTIIFESDFIKKIFLKNRDSHKIHVGIFVARAICSVLSAVCQYRESIQSHGLSRFVYVARERILLVDLFVCLV